MKNKQVKIGTRGSALALYQANKVKDELSALFPDFCFQLEIIKTTGDKILDVALSKIGDKGLFTKEIENSLLAEETDLAVHSLKDLPTSLPEGLFLAGVLKRGEVRDALVSSNGLKLKELNSNHKIATSSLRRKAQLLAINPDFRIVDIRGNVNTRLQKMEGGYCDAMIMAGAGLQRLGFEKVITEVIDPEVIIPAVGQGAIAIEARKNDKPVLEMIGQINDKQTMVSIEAERIFMRILEGGCQIPVGCFTSIESGNFSITGFIANIDGSLPLRETLAGPVSHSKELAEKLANNLLEKGGKDILKNIREINH